MTYLEKLATFYVALTSSYFAFSFYRDLVHLKAARLRADFDAERKTWAHNLKALADENEQLRDLAERATEAGEHLKEEVDRLKASMRPVDRPGNQP